MITIHYNGEDITIKNQPNELLVKDLEKITTVLNTDKTIIDKWSEILIYLGVNKEIVEDIEPEAFIEIIKRFNNINNYSEYPFIPEIEIKGVKYYLPDGDFKLKLKQVSLIESAIKNNQSQYLGDILAICYKRDDIEQYLQYDKAHLDYKAELFRDHLTVDYVLPILGYLTKIFVAENEVIK